MDIERRLMSKLMWTIVTDVGWQQETLPTPIIVFIYSEARLVRFLSVFYLSGVVVVWRFCHWSVIDLA